jgi:hypothetical protein
MPLLLLGWQPAELHCVVARFDFERTMLIVFAPNEGIQEGDAIEPGQGPLTPDVFQQKMDHGVESPVICRQRTGPAGTNFLAQGSEARFVVGDMNHTERLQGIAAAPGGAEFGGDGAQQDFGYIVTVGPDIAVGVEQDGLPAILLPVRKDLVCHLSAIDWRSRPRMTWRMALRSARSAAVRSK